MHTGIDIECVAAEDRRERCQGCLRPRRDCYCAAIPSVDNQTEVLILQHRRERFHPFNTARIVHRALRNSTILIDHVPGIAARLALRPRAGLLYPGTDAALLTEVPAHQLPEQLIVIDGTWHHAKTVVRDIPALGEVPRYRLAPQEPSRYRIRREPHAELLSTVEATVAALRMLEPETSGLDQMLEAFYRMVERQLAYPKTPDGWRRNAARIRHARNIPYALLGDLNRIVALYGESLAVDTGDKTTVHVPVYWTAERLGTGERFACLISPPAPPQEAMLRHWKLSAEDFSDAVTLDEARTRWQAFQRADDVVAVYNNGTARLLEQITHRPPRCIVLKSIDFNPLRRYATLDELMAAEGLTVAPDQLPGRAGRRLANAVALIEHLRALRHCHVA